MNQSSAYSLAPNIQSTIKGRGFSFAMFVCVIGFVLFKRFYRDLGDVCIFIVIIGTIASLHYEFRAAKKDPILIAFFISLCIPVLSWANSVFQIPELAKENPSPLLFYDFFFFWFIAYWTNGNTARITTVLLAYCFSVLGIFISHSTDFAGDILQGISGARIDLGLVNAQHTSLFAGFGLISATFIFISKLDASLKVKIVKNIISAALVLFFLLVILITQSRQVWLAVLICLLLAPMARKLLSYSQVSTRSTIITYIAIAVIIGSALNLDIVKHRVAMEKSTVKEIAQLDLDSVPNSGSIGLRIHLWLEAWEWIKERPLLGSGEDARELVISESKSLPDLVRSNFTHLHNSHLETLVSFGIVGSALIYFLILWPPFYTITMPSNSIRKSWKAFSLIVVIFWLTVNLFESYFYSANGAYIFSVFFGIIYSFKLRKTTNLTNEPQEKPRNKYFCQT